MPGRARVVPHVEAVGAAIGIELDLVKEIAGRIDGYGGNRLENAKGIGSANRLLYGVIELVVIFGHRLVKYLGGVVLRNPVDRYPFNGCARCGLN